MGLGLTTIVLLVAVVPACLTVFLWDSAPRPLTLLLLHSTLTGVVVAVAASDYAAHKSSVLLGKDPSTGQVALWSWVVWWPYHLGLRIKLAVKPLVITDEPLYHKILPGWFLGGWPHSAAVLPQVESLSVLDVTCELPRSHSQPYKCLPVWDTQAPRVRQIEAGVQWLLQERAAGRPVYIHCAHGHGRSAILMAACLLRAGLARDTGDAIRIMQAVRPRVKINGRQRAALEEWAEATEATQQGQALATLSGGGGGGGSGAAEATKRSTSPSPTDGTFKVPTVIAKAAHGPQPLQVSIGGAGTFNAPAPNSSTFHVDVTAGTSAGNGSSGGGGTGDGKKLL